MMTKLIQILILLALTGCSHMTFRPRQGAMSLIPAIVTPIQAQDAAREVLGSLYLSPGPPITVLTDESLSDDRLAGQVGGVFRCSHGICSIEVTADEGDLAHELLHYFEYQSTGDANGLHKGWSAKGFEEKIYAYQDRIGVPHNRGY